jgi:hypothetical protein
MLSWGQAKEMLGQDAIWVDFDNEIKGAFLVCIQFVRAFKFGVGGSNVPSGLTGVYGRIVGCSS